MTHETTIKRIQKLVPSVMELEFGCEVVLYSEEYSKNRRILKVLDKRNVVGVDTIVEVCENNSNGVSHISYVAKNELKILGKPITLAVVLRAVGKQLDEDAWEIALNSNGEFIKDWGESRHETTGDFWNLSKDNFNDQSEETKSFIGGLLN